jgi:putative transcriptional regulator
VLELSAGVLLVANPQLPDPNFDRTVVLILSHGVDGAIGVVINRPGDLPAPERFHAWRDVLGDDDVLYVGGPVGRTSVIALGRRSSDDVLLPGVRPGHVLPGLGIVDLDEPEDELRTLRALRLYAGYAGWAPGQLEGEVEAGGWWVVAARADDLWAPRPELLWRDVLRRQPGTLALVSSYPPDPALN